MEDDLGVNEGEDSSSSEQELNRRERKCDFCKEVIKSLIPHVKMNKNCEDYYCEKFIPDNESKTQAERLKMLGATVNKMRKIEAQKRKRENIEFVKEMNRRKRNQRQTNNNDAKKCYKDFADKVFKIMSETCNGCNCHVSPQYLSKIECKKSDIEESVYLCRLCQRLEKDLDDISEYAGDDSYSEEYNVWAENHFNVKQKIQEMESMFHSESLQVSMRVYNSEERNLVIFPEIDSKHSLFQVDARDDNTGEQNKNSGMLPGIF